jgi:conjugal transfer mating pair stabilization protein TraN
MRGAVTPSLSCRLAAWLVSAPLWASAAFGQSMICAVDLNGDGAADAPGEQAACAPLAGGYQCPLQAARCTVSSGQTPTVPVSIATARGTILSADGMMPTLYVLPGAATESSGVLRVPIKLWPASASPVTATAVIAGQTATVGTDFAPIAFVSLSFPPGQTDRVISILLIDDATPEPPETVRVSLLGAFNADIGVGFANGTIVDDDGGPALWMAGDFDVESGGGVLPFTIHLTAPLTEALTVNYSSAAQTATAGADYTDVSGTVTFAPGETSHLVTAPILLDTEIEDAETVALSVTVAAAATETCPLDASRPCFDDGSGAKVCSLQSCFAASAVNPEVIEPPGPLPDNSGPRSATGECLGRLEIFPGKGSRCRLSGVKTTFKNCCKNDGGSLKDSMGSISSLSLGVRTIKTIVEAAQAATTGGVAAANQVLATSFDPTTLAISLAIYAITELLLKGCDQRDIETALLNSSKYCVFVGEYCAEKSPLVGCVQKANSFCCYNSMLARIIQQQGRAQIPSMGGFGTPEQPNCRGFTPTEFQALDFSKMDLTEYYAEIRTKAQGVMEGEVRSRVSANGGR